MSLLLAIMLSSVEAWWVGPLRTPLRQAQGDRLLPLPYNHRL
ncbi:MAG: hypothetical protein JWR38_2404 [Mucilaginibacter sp.]|nr:hypothetical protein [Mucilaginibacter sp.]